jgi:hypothetical protein
MTTPTIQIGEVQTITITIPFMDSIFMRTEGRTCEGEDENLNYTLLCTI